MATIQLGAFITSIKGSVGGTSFQKSGTRSTARNRSSTGRSSTNSQQLMHQRHQKRLNEWQALNLNDRQLWNSYASLYPKVNKFGTAKQITGQNWFESVNTALEIIEEPTILIPAAHDLPISIEPFYLTFVNGYFELVFTSPQDLTLNSLMIWATPLTGRSSFSVNQIRKLIGIEKGAIINGLSLQPEYETVFPTDAANIPSAVNKQIIICLQTVKNNSGITSPFLCNFAEINPNAPALDDSPFYYYL